MDTNQGIKQGKGKETKKKKEEKPVTAQLGWDNEQLRGHHDLVNDVYQGTGCFRKVPHFFN